MPFCPTSLLPLPHFTGYLIVLITTLSHIPTAFRFMFRSRSQVLKRLKHPLVCGHTGSYFTSSLTALWSLPSRLSNLKLLLFFSKIMPEKENPLPLRHSFAVHEFKEVLSVKSCNLPGLLVCTFTN